MQRSLTIGTRGSPLALAQAREAQALIARAAGVADGEAGQAFPIEVIATSGDRIQDRALVEAGGKGLFTKELEEALADGRIDLAVHSLKDVPAFPPDSLVIAATPAREDPRDALISPSARRLDDLPRGARVGTASARRGAQTRHRRPDIEIVLLRGNVQTRLRKIEEGAADATFLACAGLNRLGLSDIAAGPIAAEDMLSAPCQGIIAYQCRADDPGARDLLALVDHEETAVRAAAERRFLGALDGSCRTPIAALAELEGGRLRLRGEVLSLDGAERWARDVTVELGADKRADAAALGLSVAEALRADAGGAVVFGA